MHCRLQSCVNLSTARSNFFIARGVPCGNILLRDKGKLFHLPGTIMLETLDLKLKLDKKTYRQHMEVLQHKIFELQRGCLEAKIPVVIVFEGWQASGKGTAIKALTEQLDARGYSIHPTQAPRSDEIFVPWLWRFWKKLPNYGETAIFDLSWYGRVLVERVEKLTPRRKWKLAYRHIEEFERQLTDDGCVVLKFFMHISKSEQKKRFRNMEQDPLESWKVDKSDWEEQKKREKYEEAIEEMLEKNNSANAPWILVEVTDKRWAKIKILEAVIAKLEAVLASK